MKNNTPSPEAAAVFMRDAMVSNRIDFFGPWDGWKMRGRELVSPEGQRMTPQRLEGLLWRDAMELRRAGFASRRKAEAEKHRNQRVKVVVVTLHEFLAQKVGAA